MSPYQQLLTPGICRLIILGEPVVTDFEVTGPADPEAAPECPPATSITGRAFLLPLGRSTEERAASFIIDSQVASSPS